MHLFLCVGVSDLDMAGGGVFAIGLRRRRDPMNAILSNPATRHDDKITRPSLF